MFSTPDVWMTFKAAKLAVVNRDDVERRMAECQFVIEPFSFELAAQLGDAVLSHVFTEAGALRSELSSATLDPRVPLQRLHARGAEGVPATVIEDVDILKLTCSRQVDDRSGKEWIKATVYARFDFAANVHREWIATYFGYGFYATFEAVQDELFDSELETVAETARRLKTA